MTLDRIDNERGHVRDNVHPACYRCNVLRGNMPYHAWTIIAPAVRKAQEAGLFRNWEWRSKKQLEGLPIR